MSKPVYNHECEALYPHNPDVLEREFAEDGFAKGWSMHAKPVPEYFFDSHVHYSGGKNNNIFENLRIQTESPEAFGVKHQLIIFQIYGKKWNPGIQDDNNIDGFKCFTVEEFKNHLNVPDNIFTSNKHFWSAYINYQSSEKELVHAAADMGARCIKLHNAPQIEDNAPFDLWYSNEWQDVFDAITERKLPVLWHVTQRLPSSVYTSGARNVYWKTGWRNGVTYNNEDLLQVFLTCCRRNPEINFIGAHQLHIGWDRLDDLFTAHKNLYVDTTIGCILRMYDDFYPHDKEYLRSVFIRWADRILFGTDTFGDYSELNYLQHMRFITALDLPQDVLDKICHGNTERLCGIK